MQVQDKDSALMPTLECVTTDSESEMGCGPGDCGPVNRCYPDDAD